MIKPCADCQRWFEDQYRSTICPHQTFPANNGNNVFMHHGDAYLSDTPPGAEPALSAPYGPSVVGGHLFHKLLDGSTVSCVCIDGETAEKVVAAARHRDGVSPDLARTVSFSAGYMLGVQASMQSVGLVPATPVPGWAAEEAKNAAAHGFGSAKEHVKS